MSHPSGDVNADYESAKGSNCRRPPDRSYLLLLFACAMIALAVVGVGFVFIHEVPATKLTYACDETLSSKDFVSPLSRRLKKIVPVKTIVQADGDRQISITIASTDPSILDEAKATITAMAELRFLIVANRVDHQQTIDLALQPTVDGVDPNDVIDADGNTIGRWVQVGRESSPVQSVRGSLRVDPTEMVVRSADTHKSLSLSQLSGNMPKRIVSDWLDQKGIKDVQVLMAVSEVVEVRGEDMAFVSLSFDQSGKPCVAFSLTDQGSARFFALTTSNAPVGNRQRQLGIVMDNVLLSAPNILQPIRKEGRITGNFTQEEVENIVRALAVGQLPGELSANSQEEIISLPLYQTW